MRTETDPVRNSHKARSVGRPRTGGQVPWHLDQAEALTSTRDRYWRFTNQTVPSERAVPIWASELEWFLAALEKLAECPTDLSSLTPADLPYPFAVRPAGTTMLLQNHVKGIVESSIKNPLGALALYKDPGDGQADLDGMYRTMFLFWQTVKGWRVNGTRRIR